MCTLQLINSRNLPFRAHREPGKWELDRERFLKIKGVPQRILMPMVTFVFTAASHSFTETFSMASVQNEIQNLYPSIKSLSISPLSLSCWISYFLHSVEGKMTSSESLNTTRLSPSLCLSAWNISPGSKHINLQHQAKLFFYSKGIICSMMLAGLMRVHPLNEEFSAFSRLVCS